MAKSLSRDRDKYTVLIANTGNEALEILKKHTIDLAITDIRMPDINGLDLLTAIKNNYPGTKVIIMTAYGSSDIQKEANKRGSLYYIEKPFEITDIRKLVLDILWKKSGFEGKVFDLQLSDVIQLNCLGRVTAALKVTKGKETGLIYFNEGEIVHAECAGQIGKEALFAILRWREGKFDHERGKTPPQQSISQNWEHLLVEGMRKNDEVFLPRFGGSEPASADIQAFGDDEAVSETVTRQGDQKEAPVEEAVRSISRLSGCEGMMILSEDGIVLAHRAIKNTVKEGALVAFLGILSQRLSQTLDTGELHRILLGRKKTKVILRNRPYYCEVHLKEGVRFDEISHSIWQTLNDLGAMDRALGSLSE